MMAVQTPAMAAEVETLPEASTQETVQETAWEETELQTEETKQQIEETQSQTFASTEVTEFETQSQTEEQIETTELAEIETEAQAESEAQHTPTQEEIITESATEKESREAETMLEPENEKQSTGESATEPEIELESESEELSLIEESEELEVLSEVQTYAMPTEEQITDLITLTDGWCQDDDGNITYIKGGELVQNQVLEIDGNYYGFDENGILYVNQSFNMYKSDNGVDYVMVCYRAKEDGSLYVNEWYTNQLGNHYYYGQKGEGYSGLHEVDGKTYYLVRGKVCTNQCVSENGKSYYCDPEGSVSDISGDGWRSSGRLLLLYKEWSVFIKYSSKKLESPIMDFDYRGVMYANRDFSIWNFESRNEFGLSCEGRWATLCK